MDDRELFADEDNFVFVPTGWDFAVELGVRVDPVADREALDELADAMLVSLEDRPELEAVTDSAMPRIWSDDLERSVREGLEQLRRDADWKASVDAALAELDAAPLRAEVAREVVRHLARQLADVRTPFAFCLDCLDDHLAAGPRAGVRAVAVEAALATCRNVHVTADELLDCIRDPRLARGLGTRERRLAVRDQLGRIARFAREALPSLAAALGPIAAEELPADPDADDVWQVVLRQLLSEVSTAHAN